jgi:3'-phosphoadenosine 5'-phosphosulfate (PAPS) 3'-phosphatase
MEKILLQKLEKTIKDASHIMMEGAKKIKDAKIKTKGDANNFVTEYDVAVQHFLEEKLSEIFPAAFLFFYKIKL